MRFLLIIALVLILAALYFTFIPDFLTYMDNPPVNLEGVIWEKDGLIAIISKQVLKEGDAIEGYRVIRIGRGDSVILSSNDQMFKLTFNGLFKLNSIQYAIKSWFEDRILPWFNEGDNKETLAPSVSPS